MEISFREVQIVVYCRGLQPLEIDVPELSNAVKRGFLPGVRGTTDDGHPAVLLSADNATGHVVIGADAVMLLFRTPTAAVNDASKAREALDRRIGFLLKILETIQADPIYAGAVVNAVIPTSLPTSTLVAAVSGMIGGDLAEGVTDLSVEYTKSVDSLHHKVVRIQNFKLYDSTPVTYQIRLSPDAASERGIVVSVDYNSRYGYNEGGDPIVDRDELNVLVDGAFTEAQAQAARVVEKLQGEHGDS